jgi:alpha-1,3/alpha-1,6-mannosyltransferase
MFLDFFEEITTGMAKVILVNSQFTAGVFGRSFKILNKLIRPPTVVYPAIQEEIFKSSSLKVEDILTVKPKHILMSLNRYERKKNIPLALKAFSSFLMKTQEDKGNYHLVIAGGYDDAVPENKEVYDQLVQLMKDLKLPESQVHFLKSISNDVRITLL